MVAPTEIIRFGTGLSREADASHPQYEVRVNEHGFSWKHHYVNFFEGRPTTDLAILLQAIYLQGRADAKQQIRDALA